MVTGRRTLFPENVLENAKCYNKLRVYPGNRKLNIFKEATVFKSLQARKQIQKPYTYIVHILLMYACVCVCVFKCIDTIENKAC